MAQEDNNMLVTKTEKIKVFLPKTKWEKLTFFAKGFKIFDTEWDKHPQLIYCSTDSIQYGGGGMGWNRVLHPAGTISLPQRRYWCCDCGNELEDGPEGGCAVNVVCKTCRLNYGCLPGYDPR